MRIAIGLALVLALPGSAFASEWKEAFRYVREQRESLTSPFSSPAGLEGLLEQAWVVTLGEHDHGLKQQTGIRRPFFEHLVRHHGFTHLMAESGLLEGRLIDRYIQGDPELSTYAQVIDGMTHSMGTLEGNRSLVEWMRSYNADPANAGKPKLRYYGLDLPVMGDDLQTVFEALNSLKPFRPMDPGLLALARKAGVTLRIVDKLVAAASGGKLQHVDPDYLDYLNSLGLGALSPVERETLLFRAESLPEMGSGDEWGHRLTILARQIASDLRAREYLPAFPQKNAALALFNRAGLDTVEKRVKGLFPESSEVAPSVQALLTEDVLPEGVDPLVHYKDYFTGRQSRERGMAENILLTVRFGAKALVVGANAHFGKGSGDLSGYSAGFYVGKSMGAAYLSLGSLGRSDDHENSVEYLFNQANADKPSQPYFLSLRQAPEWFRGKREMRIGPLFIEQVDLTSYYDGLLYFPVDGPDQRVPR